MHQVRPEMGVDYRTKFVNDIKTLDSFSHHNIIQLVGAMPEPLAVVVENLQFKFDTEYECATSLAEFLTILHTNTFVEQYQSKFDIMRCISFDVANGLTYLQRRNLVYFTLSTNNIRIINDRGATSSIIIAKISEFSSLNEDYIDGASPSYLGISHDENDTLPFKSPEIVLNSKVPGASKKLISKLASVWSFGCIAYCLLNPDRLHPYYYEYKDGPGNSLNDIIKTKLSSRSPPLLSDVYYRHQEHLTDLKDVMQICMAFDGKWRPDMSLVAR